MIARLAAALCLLAPLTAQGEARAWNFRVLLDQRAIGQHQFTLTPAGDQRELRSDAQFDVRVLSLSVYRYRHEALERWDGDCLRSLVARTQTNAERQAVSAESRAGRLVVERPQGREEHAGCLMTFAYWNPRILQASRLLNVQTGEVLPVTVARGDEEMLVVRGERVSTRRHRLSAPGLEIDLWYAGECWVALEAPAAGGRRLRYELM